MQKNKILFIIFILFLLLSVSCKKKIPEPDYYLTFRLKPSEKVNYEIELNNSIIKTGTLESSWNDIEIKNQVGNYKIFFWNENYYIDYLNIDNYNPKGNRTITKHLNLNSENKKGTINVTLSKSLESDKEETIDLILKVNNTIKYISYCIYRTIGVTTAKPENDISICETRWTNVTKYGNLTNDQYYCNGLITECESINGVRCKNKRMLLPRRFDADNCYFLGKTLKNENFSITLNIKNMYYFDEKDHIKVYILDMDLSKKRILGQRQYSFDEELGIEDEVFVLK